MHLMPTQGSFDWTLGKLVVLREQQTIRTGAATPSERVLRLMAGGLEGAFLLPCTDGPGFGPLARNRAVGITEMFVKSLI
jgi:hypothetical protein